MAKKGTRRGDVTSLDGLSNAAAGGKRIESTMVAGRDRVYDTERPLSGAYAIFGNDLASDNLENDLTAADRQDV